MLTRVFPTVALLAALAVASSANADVLIDTSHLSGRCIKLGVWYQSYSGGPRTITSTVYGGGRLHHPPPTDRHNHLAQPHLDLPSTRELPRATQRCALAQLPRPRPRPRPRPQDHAGRYGRTDPCIQRSPGHQRDGASGDRTASIPTRPAVLVNNDHRECQQRMCAP